MSARTSKVLRWTPRILSMVCAAFISLFALDVFGVGYSPWETLLALLIHMVPTGIILLALAVAWRWQWAGGILFLGLGLLYILGTGARLPLSAYMCISGPLFVSGMLFLIDAASRARQRQLLDAG